MHVTKEKKKKTQNFAIFLTRLPNMVHWGRRGGTRRVVVYAVPGYYGYGRRGGSSENLVLMAALAALAVAVLALRR